jgi:hypothetical protein
MKLKAFRKIKKMTLDYSELSDGSEIAESVILEKDIEEFEECLKELELNCIGYDELKDSKVKMIHDELN